MAFARGKVILLGEHAVVYDRPALAAALEQGVRSRAEASGGENELVIPPWGVRWRESAPTHEPTFRAWQALLDLYADHPWGPRRRPLRIELDVGLPGGGGLGCSAAMGVATLAAIDEVLGIARSTHERAERSLVWERVFHGQPSGVDSAMAAAGGIAIFQRGREMRPLSTPEPVRLVIAHSGVSSSTHAMVQRVAQLRELSPERANAIFDEIAALVDAGRRALEAGDLAMLAASMNRNHELLYDLQVSTPELDHLCEVARAQGALGAKLTGAGGGGCMIALVADAYHESRVVEALRAQGRETFAAGIATQPGESRR